MLRKLGKISKDNQGFTLVELMIVVAIIGILAAIAIPQFAAYRQRGFNSSAQSDVRNAKTGEEVLQADHQVYGSTFSGAILPGPGLVIAGAAIQGPLSAATTAANGAGLSGATNPGGVNTPVGVGIGVGNNVWLHARNEAGAAAGNIGSFTIVGRHGQGPRAYGTDGDTTAIYFCEDSDTFVGSGALTVALPVSVAGTNDFVGAGGAAIACGGAVAPAETLNWTAQ